MMSQLLHQFIHHYGTHSPDAPALGANNQWLSYQQLSQQITQVSQQLTQLIPEKQQTVAVFLPKCPEAVIAIFATSETRGIFVPINPVLKPQQTGHILQDSQARVLITNTIRWEQLRHQAPAHLQYVILTDKPSENDTDTANENHGPKVLHWSQLTTELSKDTDPHQNIKRGIESDLAAIFYTSGSTGKPKGVMLTQRNMVLGANSVADYLNNHAQDRLLAVQPLSFDYGFSQLSIAFSTGASIYLMEYLFPQDVIKQVEAQNITALALVPPLWIKLANCPWPEKARKNLRYFTNTGGAMPQASLTRLRDLLPHAQPFLMYGLTEAFRSCYLPPDQIDKKPGSFGKAIPNAEILVINSRGNPCQPHEPGELIHKGALVSPGYWNDPQKTAERFKPAPDSLEQRPSPELAVWSGDIVTQDEDGFLYFVGRNDDMIKTSGYRLSPSEIEEVLYQSGLVAEAIVLGVPHEELGQAVVLLVVPHGDNPVNLPQIKSLCLKQLPGYMQPRHIRIQSDFPRNPNGKFDRYRIKKSCLDLFNQESK